MLFTLTPVIYALHYSKKKEAFAANCKKTYTEEELQAAVSEIQSGKLGTRRASVLYGIPRSTLRNKIFKMGSDKSESLYASLNGSDSMDDSMEIAMKWSELLQGSNLALLSLPQLPFNFHLDYAMPLNLLGHEDGIEERKIEYLRKKHNLGKMREPYETQYSHNLKLPVLKDIIQKLAEERIEMERNASIVRQIKQQDKDMKSSLLSEGATLLSTHNVGSYDLPTDLASDIIIPSFKPVQTDDKEQPIPQGYLYQSSLDKLDNSRIGDALKDIIVKTISEKVRFKSQALSDYCQSSLRGQGHMSDSDTSSKDSSSTHSNISSPVKRLKIEESPKKKVEQPAKKTRPKRGQYRRYNSQLLMEAVKAVQRGEMSVHRAGSYYGVPHSTLEYKVKERHLLRQKKIKEQREQKEAEQAALASSSGSRENTSSGSSSRENSSSSSRKSNKDQCSTKSAAKGDNSKENDMKKVNTSQNWLAPFLPGNANFDMSNMGLYNASGFALNTPASELLRKLQHKVQSKGEEEMERGSSYDHLVRSSKVSALGDGFMFLN